MSLAILDLGSSAFHLLVSPENGQPAYEKRQMVRLGASSFGRGFIDDDACHRGLDAIGALLPRAYAHGGSTPVTVATSAIREARNGAAFVQRVRQRFGLSVEILSGEDEARLTYRGATEGHSGRIAVVDLGGGSLGLAAGVGSDVTHALSVPTGVLRLRERHAQEGGELGASGVAAITASVTSAAVATLAALGCTSLVFTSGTARAAARLAGGSVLSLATLRALEKHLRDLTVAQVIALGVEEHRAATLATGIVMMRALTEMLGFGTISVSSVALREGLVQRERAARALHPGVRLAR